jgi:putative endonuclease
MTRKECADCQYAARLSAFEFGMNFYFSEYPANQLLVQSAKLLSVAEDNGLSLSYAISEARRLREKKPTEWCVYLLICKDGFIYCGVTNDLNHRIEAHNAGKGAKFTRGRRPVKLFAYRSCPDRSTAQRVEYKIKQMTRARKLELAQFWER